MTPVARRNTTTSGDTNISGPTNSIGFSLSQVGLETARQFGEIVGALGLEPRTFAVMHAVHRAEKPAQQSIADRLAIPASSMVAIVDLSRRRKVTRTTASSHRSAHANLARNRARRIVVGRGAQRSTGARGAHMHGPGTTRTRSVARPAGSNISESGGSIISIAGPR